MTYMVPPLEGLAGWMNRDDENRSEAVLSKPVV